MLTAINLDNLIFHIRLFIQLRSPDEKSMIRDLQDRHVANVTLLNTECPPYNCLVPSPEQITSVWSPFQLPSFY